MSDPTVATATVTVTSTLSATGTASAAPRFSYPMPPPFPFPPPPGVPTPFTPGAMVTPLTAVLCILTIAACYWALKQSDLARSVSSEMGADQSKDGKEKASGDTNDNKSASAVSPITPAAFITMFCFVLLAAVMIQGPLGISQAFAATERPASTTGAAAVRHQRFGLSQILEAIGASSKRRTPVKDDRAAQLGGRSQVVGPNGAATSDWYINQDPIGSHSSRKQQSTEDVLTDALGGMSVVDRILYQGLPRILQDAEICRTAPSLCSSLMSSLEESQDVPQYYANGQGVVQPKPIPLIPKQGFFGTCQGLKTLENAFYPLLIGAIALVVLFDYGT